MARKITDIALAVETRTTAHFVSVRGLFHHRLIGLPIGILTDRMAKKLFFLVRMRIQVGFHLASIDTARSRRTIRWCCPTFAAATVKARELAHRIGIHFRAGTATSATSATSATATAAARHSLAGTALHAQTRVVEIPEAVSHTLASTDGNVVDRI